MAVVKTSYVSEYVIETARAMLPAGELDKRLLKLEQDAARLETRLRGIDGSGAKAGVGLKSAAAGAKEAEAGVGGVASKLGVLKLAIGAVIASGLISFLGGAAEAWNVQERAVGQVEARLRSTGNVIGLTVQEIRSYAAGIQTLTGVNDELLLQQASVLLSFKNITREAFPEALKAALDLSVGLGIDLNGAVIQVAKALDDPIRGLTALRRSGTIFSVEQEKVIKSLVDTGRAGEAQMLILKELQSQYGGSAEAARQAGIPFAALKAELGDIMEEVGGLLGAGGLKSLVETMISGARATKEWLGELRAYFTEIDRGEELLREYRDRTIEATKAQDDLTESFKRTAEQVIAQQKFQEILRDIEALQSARAGFLPGAGRASLANAEWKQAFSESDRQKVEEYDAAIEAAEKSLADFVAGLRTAAREGNIGEFLGSKGAAEALREVNPALRELGGLLGEVGRLETAAKIEKLTDAWTELLGAQAPEREILRDLARQFIETEAAEKAVTEATKASAKATKEAAAEEKKRLEQRKEEVDAFYALAVAAKTYRDAVGNASIKPIEPAVPFHDSGKALSKAAETFAESFGMQNVKRAPLYAKTFAEKVGEYLHIEDLGGKFAFAAKRILIAVANAMADKLAGALAGGGTSSFGGEKSGTAAGELSSAGGQIGAMFGPAGEIWGKFLGAAIGAFIKKGADDAEIVIEEAGRDALARVQYAEGGLKDFAAGLADALTSFFSNFEDKIADLDVNLAGLSVHVRNDIITVAVNGLVQGFRDLDSALAWAAEQTLAAQKDLGALGENMRRLFEGFGRADATGSFAELQQAIDLASRADATVSLNDAHIQLLKTFEKEIEIARRYGLVIDDVIALTNQRIQKERESIEAQLRSAQGASGIPDDWRELGQGVDEFNRLLEGQAQSIREQIENANADLAVLLQQRDEFGEVTRENRAEYGAIVRQIRAIMEEIAALEKALGELPGAISAEEFQAAVNQLKRGLQVDLYSTLAGLAETAGQGKLAEELKAKALALSTRMQLLSIRATLEAARAAGILSDEQVQGFNAIIRAIRDGIMDLGGFGALGKLQGGKGGGKGQADVLDIRTREEALADFERLMIESSDAINGVTAEERQRLNVIAQLDSDLAAGLLTAEEYRQAIANLDAVMAAATARAQQEITDRWQEIGASVGESTLGGQLRRFAEQAAEDLAAGGQGIPAIFAAQVQDWFAEALKNADTADERRELLQTFRDFVADLPPELRRALRGSHIGRVIADGIAEAVAAENIAAIIERVMAATGESGILFPQQVGAVAGAGPAQAGRAGVAGAASQAADELARLRQELQGIIDSSRRSELGPLNRQLAEIFDRFARAGSILKTLNAAGERWNETAQQMAVELGRFWESALSSVRDLLAEIRGSREAPVDTFTRTRSTFEELTANLPADLTQLDPDELKKIVDASKAYRAAGTGLFGEGFGSGIVDKQLEDLLAAIEASAPTEEDLLLQALELLREQTVVELQKANESLGSGGPIAVAVADSSTAAVEATDLQLVELARITGSLAGTISVLDELSPDQVAELRNTVERLLSLEYLSEEQRDELRALQTVLDNEEVINTLKGTLAVSDTLSRDELTSVIALLGGTLAVADQLAPSQIAELRSIVAGLLGLENLSEEQRAALLAAQATLGSIYVETAGVKTGVDGTKSETGKVKTAVDLMASEVTASNRTLNKLNTIIDRLGAGDLNDTARRVLNKLDTVIDRLGSGGFITNRLDAIAGRLGTGNVNATLAEINATLKAMKAAGGFGTAG